jgi:hypothetical protein
MTETSYYARVSQRLREEYLPYQKGKLFSTEDIHKHFDIGKYPLEQARQIKHNISQVLWNLSEGNKKRELEQVGNKYRLIDKNLAEVEWWKDEEQPKPCLLKLPLGLNDYCILDSPCLIVVATPTNQGKTAMMCNIVNQNLDTYKDNIFFFESDPVDQLKRRFKSFEFPIPIPPPFKVYKRLMNFEDVVQPNGLNLIDYLRVDPEKPAGIATPILKILSKLDTGIGVIGLQSPQGRDLAFGKDFTAFDCNLYISIAKHEGNYNLKFIKVKTPNHEFLGDKDIYQYTIQFKMRNGVQLYDIHTNYGDM